MNYRDETETLRAENARLLDRVAKMEATMKAEEATMRWSVGWMDSGRGIVAAVCATLYAVFTLSGVLVVVGHWVNTGGLPPIGAPGLRLAAVMAVLALAWSLAFVRRVPR